jgi:hypothetical protein
MNARSRNGSDPVWPPERPAAPQLHLHYKVTLAASQEIVYIGK